MGSNYMVGDGALLKIYHETFAVYLEHHTAWFSFYVKKKEIFVVIVGNLNY